MIFLFPMTGGALTVDFVYDTHDMMNGGQDASVIRIYEDVTSMIQAMDISGRLFISYV